MDVLPTLSRRCQAILGPEISLRLVGLATTRRMPGPLALLPDDALALIRGFLPISREGWPHCWVDLSRLRVRQSSGTVGRLPPDFWWSWERVWLYLTDLTDIAEGPLGDAHREITIAEEDDGECAEPDPYLNHVLEGWRRGRPVPPPPEYHDYVLEEM